MLGIIELGNPGCIQIGCIISQGMENSSGKTATLYILLLKMLLNKEKKHW
jgi:hypothetical protein